MVYEFLSFDALVKSLASTHSEQNGCTISVLQAFTGATDVRYQGDQL
jgi:hypothetical protein